MTHLLHRAAFAVPETLAYQLMVIRMDAYV